MKRNKTIDGSNAKRLGITERAAYKLRCFGGLPWSEKGDSRDSRNQKRRERRRADPSIKANERAYREAERENISLYRKQNSDKRAAQKRAYRQRNPGECIGYANRTGRSLVRSGVLSLSVMRGGGSEISDGRPSVLDELIAREEGDE